MSNLNFGFENVKTSEASENKYLGHGVHEVKITSLEHKELAGANYTGDAWDITFTNTESGLSTSVRMFPFKASDKAVKYVKGKATNEILTEAEQWETYKSRVKHIFTKAIGEDNFSKVMKSVKNIKDMFATLKRGIESKVNQEFAVLVINDKNNYAKIPMNWTGGFCATLENKSLLENTYTKNITKYGPQVRPSGGFDAPVGNTSSNSLSFLDGITSNNTPVQDMSVNVGTGSMGTDESDDLPF